MLFPRDRSEPESRVIIGAKLTSAKSQELGRGAAVDTVQYHDTSYGVE